MLAFFRKFFGGSTDYKSLMEKNAQIIDVRTVQEFKTGHIPQSINIPIQELPHKLKLIHQDRPVITCCASGMRSAAAKSMLLNHGYSEVYNGGSWQGLMRQLAKIV